MPFAMIQPDICSFPLTLHHPTEAAVGIIVANVHVVLTDAAVHPCSTAPLLIFLTGVFIS